MSRSRSWFVFSLVGLLAVAAIVAGCGSSDSSDSTGSSSSTSPTSESGGGGGDLYPASFKTMVEEAKEPITKWPGPTTSPKLKPSQLVFSIPCSKIAEGCQFINEGVEEAAKAAGWEYQTVNPEGDPDKSNAAIRQAVAAGADAIVIISIDPKLVAGPLAEAEKAGIAVIMTTGGHEDELPFLEEHGVSHDVSIHAEFQGELLGAFAAVEGEGEAQLAMFTAPEFPTITQRYDGTRKTLEECPGCSVVSSTNFTQTEIATKLGPAYQSVLQANPSVNFGWVGLDAAAGVMVAAAEQPGAIAPPLLGFDGNKQNIEFVLEGKQLADVGAPLHWMGWAALDNANRILQGEPAVKDDGIPSRLITKENAGEYVENGFQGGINYQEKYEQLWTTGKTDSSVKPEQ